MPYVTRSSSKKEQIMVTELDNGNREEKKTDQLHSIDYSRSLKQNLPKSSDQIEEQSSTIKEPLSQTIEEPAQVIMADNGDIADIVVPSINCKEKIILVVDQGDEKNTTHTNGFNVKDTTLHPLTMLKSALEQFMHNKHFIDKKHEFAIISMNEAQCTWLSDFTSEIGKLKKTLKNLQTSPTTCLNDTAGKPFDLNPLIDVISNRCETLSFDIINSNKVLPPRSIYRIIIIYGRSYMVPTLKETSQIKAFFQSPYVTVDMILTHEPQTEENCVQEIITELPKLLDKKGTAYCFDVERNAKLLYEALAKLLAHSLQRPLQTNVDYNFQNISTWK